MFIGLIPEISPREPAFSRPLRNPQRVSPSHGFVSSRLVVNGRRREGEGRWWRYIGDTGYRDVCAIYSVYGQSDSLFFSFSRSLVHTLLPLFTSSRLHSSRGPRVQGKGTRKREMPRRHDEKSHNPLERKRDAHSTLYECASTEEEEEGRVNARAHVTC